MRSKTLREGQAFPSAEARGLADCPFLQKPSSCVGSLSGEGLPRCSGKKQTQDGNMWLKGAWGGFSCEQLVRTSLL